VIVLGLGNPGAEYERTRHNAGFLVLDAAREQWGRPSWRRRRDAEECRVRVGREEHRLIRPLTWMNRSGDIVAALLRSGAGPRDLLVVLDDIDLPLGRLRIRPEGGAGGHRGLQSLLAALAPASVARMRIGVGRPEDDAGAVDHVLGDFSPEEWGRMDVMITRAVAALRVLLTAGLAAAMNRFNGLAVPWDCPAGEVGRDDAGPSPGH